MVEPVNLAEMFARKGLLGVSKAQAEQVAMAQRSRSETLRAARCCTGRRQARLGGAAQFSSGVQQGLGPGPGDLVGRVGSRGSHRSLTALLPPSPPGAYCGSFWSWYRLPHALDRRHASGVIWSQR